MRARRSIEIRTSGGRQRHRHERVRGHPVHLLADPGRQHRDTGREHPERPPEGERRVVVEVADVDLLRGRHVVERRVAEPFERARSRSRGRTSSNSSGGGASRAHAPILTTGGAAQRRSARATPPVEARQATWRARSQRAPARSCLRASSASPPASAAARRPGRSGGRGRGRSRSASTETPMIFSFVPP